MEEFVKTKSDEMVEKIRRMYLEKGLPLSKENEDFIRAGISFGISISSMALAKLPSDISLYK